MFINKQMITTHLTPEFWQCVVIRRYRLSDLYFVSVLNGDYCAKSPIYAVVDMSVFFHQSTTGLLCINDHNLSCAPAVTPLITIFGELILRFPGCNFDESVRRNRKTTFITPSRLIEATKSLAGFDGRSTGQGSPILHNSPG